MAPIGSSERLWAFGWTFKDKIAPQLAGCPRTLATAKLPDALAAARREVHLNLKQANYDLGKLQFNTVASAAMKMLNALERTPQEGTLAAEVIEEGFSMLLRLLSPITPHIATPCGSNWATATISWRPAGRSPLESALQQDEIELVLQVNGKMRGKILVPAAAGQAEIEALALASEAAVKYMEGKPAKKVVVVPGRLVNIVV